MKRQRPIGLAIALTFGVIALAAGNAAEARQLGSVGPRITMNSPSMNGSRIAPRTNFELPQNIPVKTNVRGHCVLKFIPRALSAGYSDRPRGHFGYGRRYHPGNGGQIVYEQKLVCE